MSTYNLHEQLQFLEDQSDTDLEDDEESVASLETDDGEDHPPERILAEVTSKNGLIWYLVKWTNCPILRSSWAGPEEVEAWLLEDWRIERKKQLDGESKPLDIAAFQKAQLDEELAERKRRILRRLKRKVNRAISIVTA
jgi:hypothetical protein